MADLYDALDPNKKKPQPGAQTNEGPQALPGPDLGPGMPTGPIEQSPNIDQGTYNPPQTALPGPTQTPMPAAPTGGNDFPSLPPGATPPPGYYDPVSGKTAPGGPGAPAPAAPPAPGAPPAPAAPTAAAPPPAVPMPAAPTAAPDPLKDAFRDQLLKNLNPNDPSLNDPALKGQTDAYAVQQQRAKERAREALAGRAGASGQLSDLASSGAFDQGLVGLEQQQGEAQGGFNAQLLGDAQDKQRQQIQATLALAGNTLSEEQRNQLTERLHGLDDQFRKSQLAQQGSQFDRTFGQQGQQFNTDAELRRLGITSQSDLGNRELNQRGELGRAGLNMDLLRTLMQGSQFDKGLGADLGKFNASQSNQYMQQLLQQLGG